MNGSGTGGLGAHLIVAIVYEIAERIGVRDDLSDGKAEIEEMERGVAAEAVLDAIEEGEEELKSA